MLQLTNENYFSPEANWEYLSTSQYKDFMGSIGMKGCEAQAMAKLEERWAMEMTTPLLVGSYVDAHFEGTLDLFRAQHPELFTKTGGLKADYAKAEEIIQFLKKDPLFMFYMSGEKQVIMTGNIDDTPFKIKIDSFLRDKAIVDLKCMQSLTKSHWVKDLGHVNFIDYWGYDLQAAIYQEVVRQNTELKLPFFIAGASKEKVTNKEILYIDNTRLEESLESIKSNLYHIKQLKNHEIEPVRCETCDYCRSTKMLKAPIHYSALLLDI